MDKEKVINNTVEYVKETLGADGTGHDWWHIYRVWSMSKELAKDEKVDTYVVELAALLHDIADFKFNDGDELKGGRITSEWLESQSVDKETIEKVVHIVNNVSFKGSADKNGMQSAEGFVVQDADRLDAMGAIGIARCFAYGGYKGVEIFNPEKQFRENVTKEQYKLTTPPSINHFYEKLLLLKDLMNTKAGKNMADKRHNFMLDYLEEFYKEWDGKK
ncbi:HD domain-containing protein [Patescibacteria group bacterium]